MTIKSRGGLRPRRDGLRLALLAAALGTSMIALAAPVQAQEASQSAGTRFDIPAQPLASAINMFGRQSGLQVTADATLVNGVRSQAIQSEMPALTALSHMLYGTGITWRMAGNAVVLIAAPRGADGAVQLGSVRVEAASMDGAGTYAGSPDLPPAYAGGQVATGGQLALLGNVSVMDTPFNVTNYTSQLIENQNSRSLLDVLDNDPSIRASGARDGETTTVIMRGFELTGREVLVNGMFGASDTRGTMIEAVERVEVHKGPSAMLNGVSPWGSSYGGSINYVLKRAGDAPLNRVTATYASESQFGANLDVSRRFGVNKGFGVRVNAVYRDGATDVDYTNNRSAMLAAGLDYRSDDLRVTIDLGHQDRLLKGGWSSTRIGSRVAVPKAPDARTNSKQKWEFWDGQNDYAIGRIEYDFAPGWTAAAAYSRNQSDELYIQVIDSITNVDGTKSGFPYWIPARSRNESYEGSIKGKFDTGPVSHSLSVIASANNAKRGQLNYYIANCTTGCAASNIYTPIYYPAPDTSALSKDAGRLTSQYDYEGQAVADIMSMADDRVVLMVGARRQKVGQKTFSTAGDLTRRYNRNRVSPSVGLVVKPVENLSVYASYIESLNPGGIASSYYANAGDIFMPFVTDQYEAGVKYDLGTFTVTADVFQIAVPSAVEVASTTGGSPTLEYDGLQRNRGIELNLFGQPFDHLRLLGGVMYLDAEMTKTEGGLNDGRRARGSPEFNANLGAEWDVAMVPGLTVTGRVVYTSREYIDLTTTNARSIPAWTRVDAGIRYAFEAAGRPMQVRLTADNLFDRNYWAAASRGVLTMGAPRSIRASLAIDF
ncbi:TonB-dependent receptor [Novosphingobium resinovorum]|nr:TonB-dependent receptor [Novosphingobium resinovorum]